MRVVILLSVLYLLSQSSLFGKIRNGYEPYLISNMLSLQRFRSMLEDPDISPLQRAEIKSKIKKLINFMSCYELTEELLYQFWRISPDGFNEIDTLLDSKGRPTDVYVKLIHKEKTKLDLRAASFLYQAPNDKDANVSEYGPYTVSVEVWIVDNALLLLSHELGHIKYIVPNLASYSKFYHTHYRKPVDVSCIGHIPHDPSGKHADKFERRFRADSRRYRETNSERPESILAAYTRIKRFNRRFESSLLMSKGRSLAR